MASVTTIANKVKQPWGGYLRPRNFSIIDINDGIELEEETEPKYNLIGLTVDYMTRFLSGDSKADSFKISLAGATETKETEQAQKMLSEISGLDDTSLLNAYLLTGYDVCFRCGAYNYKIVSKPMPEIIKNIRTMINRSLLFLKQYGPVIQYGFTLKGGYTELVTSGDGDFITEDTLWELKVSKRPPKASHTLQLLMYYIMGKHSIHPEIFDVKKLGIFNPRLNKIYYISIDSIDPHLITEVSEKIIGYK